MFVNLTHNATEEIFAFHVYLRVSVYERERGSEKETKKMIFIRSDDEDFANWNWEGRTVKDFRNIIFNSTLLARS